MINTLKFNAQIKDVEQINPLFSKCKIYVLYTGLNRNNSDISKEVVEQALPTIFNVPIVGEYNEAIEDFKGHGGKIEISADTGEVKFITTTKPYGVVPESSEIAWEEVTEEDGTVREYLTCTAYLWTGRMEEATRIIEKGNNQSMEITEVTGKFNKNKNFVIDSFVFSALTILGDDVEPCFESASIGAYQLNKDKFMEEFNLMVSELKQSLSNQSTQVVDVYKNEQEGGSQVEEVKDVQNPEAIVTTDDIKVETETAPVVEEVVIPPVEETETKEFTAEEETATVVEGKQEEVGPVDEEDETKEPESSQFSLTTEQMRESFRKALHAEKYEDDWGYKYSKYWYIDYDATVGLVYAEDSRENEIVSFTYTTSGDEIVIDFESRVVCKIVFVPKEGATGNEYSLVTKEHVDEKIKNMEEKFANDLKAEQDKYALVEKELSDLNEYKLNKLAEEKKLAIEELFARKEFGLLTAEEVQPLKEQAVELGLEVVEKELFALIGKKLASNFSLNAKEESPKMNIMSIDCGTPVQPGKPYQDILTKFASKNNQK